jgi:hypothetical protein
MAVHCLGNASGDGKAKAGLEDPMPKARGIDNVVAASARPGDARHVELRAES